MPSNLDLILGGAQTAGAGLKEYGEKNRQVHPTIQRFMQEVLSGRMTGKQAALAAHQEIGTFAPQSTDNPSGAAANYNDPAQTGMADAAQMSPEQFGASFGMSAQPQFMPQRSGLGAMADMRPARPGLSQPMGPPPPARHPEEVDRPFTSQDLGDLQQLAPFARATREPSRGLTLEERIALLEKGGEIKSKETAVKEEGKNTRQIRSIDSKEEIAEKKLTQADKIFKMRYQQHIKDMAQHFQEVLAQIKGRIKASASKDALQAAKLMLEQLKAASKAAENVIRSEGQAYSPDFPEDAQKELETARKEREEQTKRVQEQIDLALRAHDHAEKGSVEVSGPVNRPDSLGDMIRGEKASRKK